MSLPSKKARGSDKSKKVDVISCKSEKRESKELSFAYSQISSGTINEVTHLHEAVQKAKMLPLKKELADVQAHQGKYK